MSAVLGAGVAVWRDSNMVLAVTNDDPFFSPRCALQYNNKIVPYFVLSFVYHTLFCPLTRTTGMRRTVVPLLLRKPMSIHALGMLKSNTIIIVII